MQRDFVESKIASFDKIQYNIQGDHKGRPYNDTAVLVVALEGSPWVLFWILSCVLYCILSKLANFASGLTIVCHIQMDENW